MYLSLNIGKFPKRTPMEFQRIVQPTIIPKKKSQPWVALITSRNTSTWLIWVNKPKRKEKMESVKRI